MRHYDTSCGPMSCVPTRKDGIRHQTPILSCSGVAIPLVKFRYKCGHFTNGIATPLQDNIGV